MLLAGKAWLDPDSLAESDKEELIVNQDHPSYRSIRDLSMTGRIHIRSGKSFKAILGLEFIKGNESDYMIQMMKRDTGNMERQYHMDPSRGLRKEFLPIINLGVWLNNTPYYAVQSINERICSTALETVGNLINDYRTNILIPALTDDSIFRSMNTDVKELFLMIKYQDSPQKLSVIIQEDGFRNMRKDMAEAIRVFTTIRRGSPSLQ